MPFFQAIAQAPVQRYDLVLAGREAFAVQADDLALDLP